MLTRQQVEMLKAYKAITAKGRLVVMAFIHQGDFVSWSPRLYVKGAAGHTKPTAEALEAVDMPAEWAEKAELLAQRLTTYYPALPTPELIVAEAKLAGLLAPKAEAQGGVVVEVAEPEAIAEAEAGI